jgi:pyridoxamine 5'-phosphate oxidase
VSFLSRLRLVLTAGQGLATGIPDAASERDPIDVFREWLRAAERAGLLLPEACALATATPGGVPSVRMVLLKGADERGFVFYTNYGSRKAGELDANPSASMCFHWAVLQRQVRIQGGVERLSFEESERYFGTRPRGSRLGAWASRQSQDLPDRATLERSFRELEMKYEGREVPLPPFWGGYRLGPTTIEFWQGRADRLHDRLVFERTDPTAPWATRRLFP